jgi:hypothetical protein
VAYSVAEGIFSRHAEKNPSKAQPAFVIAVISLVLVVLNLVYPEYFNGYIPDYLVYWSQLTQKEKTGGCLR